eukprot:m.217339 g.217339  ORF g.217339 m.217339 type:complete len:196 (-) comp33234_c0_seq1:573-1160(-)
MIPFDVVTCHAYNNLNRVETAVIHPYQALTQIAYNLDTQKSALTKKDFDSGPSKFEKSPKITKTPTLLHPTRTTTTTNTTTTAPTTSTNPNGMFPPIRCASTAPRRFCKFKGVYALKQHQIARAQGRACGIACMSCGLNSNDDGPKYLHRKCNQSSDPFHIFPPGMRRPKYIHRSDETLAPLHMTSLHQPIALHC